MDALVIFSSGNKHPLAWLLSRERRHVWCAVRKDGYWIIYDWSFGIPVISIANGHQDLARFYLDAGYEVIETTVGDEPCHGPWICNNCVGHTMVILGIRAHLIFTPYQLWKHLKKEKPMFNFLKKLEYLPGGYFTPKKPEVPPPPPPPPPPPKAPKKAHKAVQAARADEIKRSKLAAGSAGTNKTGGALSDEDASTARKTLL